MGRQTRRPSRRNLQASILLCRTPLVSKHDGGSIFHGHRIQTLLPEHQVTELTHPDRYPQSNGKKETAIRNIKGLDRAMRRHGQWSSLKQRIDVAGRDLNYDWPRPVLAGRTARKVSRQDRIPKCQRTAYPGPRRGNKTSNTSEDTLSICDNNFVMQSARRASTLKLSIRKTADRSGWARSRQAGMLMGGSRSTVVAQSRPRPRHGNPSTTLCLV